MSTKGNFRFVISLFLAFLSPISNLRNFLTLSPSTCPPLYLLRYPCAAAPFIISKPQFLDADEKLRQNVDGLNPNRDEHDIFLHLEMISSTPLSAAKRLQFALDVEPVEKFDLMSKLPRTVIPLMWVEESAHLNKTYTSLFKGLYTVLNINSVIKYSGIVLGTIGLIFTSYRIFDERSAEKTTRCQKAVTIAPSANVPASADVTRNANLQTQPIPDLQQEKKQ